MNKAFDIRLRIVIKAVIVGEGGVKAHRTTIQACENYGPSDALTSTIF